MYYVGVDYHKRYSVVCIIDATVKRASLIVPAVPITHPAMLADRNALVFNQLPSR